MPAGDAGGKITASQIPRLPAGGGGLVPARPQEKFATDSFFLGGMVREFSEDGPGMASDRTRCSGLRSHTGCLMRDTKVTSHPKRSEHGGPRLGAHMSIAGGVDKAFLRGEEIGCETMQIFTKNNNQWRAKSLTAREIEAYKTNRQKTRIGPILAHDSYLINIACPKKDLYKRSLEALRIEMERSHALEIPYLVMHPGAHLGTGEEEGIQRVVEALNTLFDQTKDLPVMICLETTAGQGSSLGYRFEHLAAIREEVEDKGRVGICLDTCHIFAAGYDIRGREPYEKTLQAFDRVVGLDHLKCIHLNDSMRELGGRVDRHAHIGQGHIGLAGFRLFVNDPRLRHLPMILETPKGDDPVATDRRNLAILRSLITAP